MYWIAATIFFALLALILALRWWRDHRRWTRAVSRLTEDVALAAEKGPDMRVRDPAHAGLEALIDAVRGLRLSWAGSLWIRRKALAGATAKTDQTISRLEAILRDLSEGVIVCTLEHEVQLYNRSALWLVSEGNRLSLARSLFEALEPGEVVATLRDLRAEEEEEATPGDVSGGPTRSLILTTKSGIEIEARMAIVRHWEEGPIGYALTLSARRGEASQTMPRADQDDVTQPRYYDFDFTPGQESHDHIRAETLEDLTYVVFDTETTGLRPSDGDELVAIAAIRIVDSRVQTQDRFETLVNPERPIPPSSTRFHGITDQDVADAPDARTALEAFKAFAADAVLVAHNAAFDMRFLTLKERTSGLHFGNAVLDTMLLSVYLEGQAVDHSLEAIATRYGIEISGRHTADGDALATARIFEQQLKHLAARDIVNFGHAVDAADLALNLRRMEQHY